MKSGQKRKNRDRPGVPVAITEEQKFFFPEGLLGFSACHDFVVGPFRPDDGSCSPFLILREGQGSFSLPLIHPQFVMPEYEIEPSPEILAHLGAHSAGDLAVMVIATLKETPEDITVNLAGPLLLNPARSLGAQIVVEHYPVRYPLLRKASLATSPSC
ncbi:MAG: flagellar assembly protein FliW [Deltaproteobacteria bacterium]|nr:flagellar assembly protein FliW [Deltaproteobacteria bacterium]